ncbi:MAG: hypothetical protein OIN86_09285 [Candidatus Methanoperedens sp.]|nr:hypothetical protein [Candidatus Methanoperedens sp.]CAG1005171.1 hypothetical protein METP1_03218 [Methanosarcinales archaeon]
MFMLYIGAGGWAYFQVPGMDPLAAYARAFPKFQLMLSNGMNLEKPWEFSAW